MTDEFDFTAEEQARLRHEVSNLTATEILEISMIERSLRMTPVNTLTLKLARGTLDRSPKKNWVENVGGLPAYIEKIAKSLHEKRGMTISRAIATAINRVKAWARGGDNVNADTRAKARAALAEWEAKKARSHRK